MRSTMQSLVLATTLAALPVSLVAGEIAVDGNPVFHSGNDGAGSGLDADLLDGLDSTDFALAAHSHAGSGYAGVAVVAKAGGDYADPEAAMSDLASWCGTPAEATSCLLEIAPGIYDLAGSLDLVPFVDVAGSGVNVTRLRGAPASNGVVNGADDSEMRHLTIEHTGGTAEVTGFRAVDSSPRLTHARIVVSANGASSIDTNGIVVDGNGSPSFRGVRVEADQGRGIQSGGSAGLPRFQDVEVICNGPATAGVVISSGQPVFRNLSVHTSGGPSTNVGVRITSSEQARIVGGRIVAEGGTEAYGILNVGSSPLLEGLEIVARGADPQNIGINNSNISGPTIRGVRILVLGGLFKSATGIRDSGGAGSATTRIYDSVIEAPLGLTDVGVHSVCANGNVQVHSSRISAAASLRQESSCVLRVAGSYLKGWLGGAVTCAGVYDEAFDFYADTCP